MPPQDGGERATHTPGQSAPPCIGSQSSLGSSMQTSSSLSHGVPRKPPHGAPVGFGPVVGVGILRERATTGGGNNGSRKAQIPEQSRPPLFGSQLSLGLSMQVWPASGQGNPPMPPQNEPSLTAHMPGQSARGSQLGVLGLGTQVWPAAQGGSPRLPQIVGVGVGVEVEVGVNFGQNCLVEG